MMAPVSSTDGQEPVRGEQAAARVPPAQQRLGAGHQPGVQVVDRLVDQLEFVVGEGGRDVGAQLELVEGAGVHRLVEDRVAAFAPPLGLIHRDVGVAQQGIRAAGPAGAGDADAEAGRHRDLAAVDADRDGERVAQPGEHGPRGDQLTFEQDGELVAAEPGDRVAGADAGAQPLGGPFEQFVAHVVAEAVVDLFEVVQVYEDHADGLPVAAVQLDGVPEPV